MKLFPMYFPTRTKRSDGSRYFGPYTDVKNMRSAPKTVKDIFMIRSCSLNLTEETIAQENSKLCLDYHIHKMRGTLRGYLSRKNYNETIDHVAKLLNRKNKDSDKDLTDRMNSYSEKWNLRKLYSSGTRSKLAEAYSSRQKMVEDDMVDHDVLHFDKIDNDCCGMILKIRDGKGNRKNSLLS